LEVFVTNLVDGGVYNLGVFLETWGFISMPYNKLGCSQDFCIGGDEMRVEIDKLERPIPK
jgi:hypothetical protein